MSKFNKTNLKSTELILSNIIHKTRFKMNNSKHLKIDNSRTFFFIIHDQNNILGMGKNSF